MVGFQMVKDDDLNFVIPRDHPQTGKKIISKIFFDGVNNYNALAAPYYIGIVACAIGGL